MTTEVLLFTATWCGPCKAYKPKFEALAAAHADKAKFTQVDIDADFEMAAQHSIRGVPTVIVLVDGAVTERASGVDKIENALAFLRK